MDLLQIEYFLAVARTENMTAAANALHVSQSSVSRCITRLEESLGVPLFERSGRGIVLSDFGKRFYKRAESVMRELSDSERELRELHDQQVGRISISTCAPRQINQHLIQFLQSHPDVLIRQRRQSNMEEIRGLLDQGVLDYALTYEPLPETNYQWTPLIEQGYYLLVSSNHTYADCSEVSLKDLANQKIILNDADAPDYIEDRLREVGVAPTFAFIGNEYEVLGPMVERNLGVALISTLSLHDMRVTVPFSHLSKICVLPIKEKTLNRTLGIVSRKHHYVSQAAKEFYQQLVDYFTSIHLEMD